MKARLPKRAFPDTTPEQARFLIKTCLTTAAATVGVRLDPSERWDWQSQTFKPSTVKRDPRSFAFQIRPLETRENFTPKGYRRRKNGQPLYSPYSSFRLAGDRTKSGTYYANACCWHGHRDFLRAFFRLLPLATVTTTHITYKGLDDFERTHRDTEHHYDHHTCNCNWRG